MQRNKLILLIGDVIIPILGYFFWNWNVYFIFLFLFLDLLSYNILYFYKHRKIQRFRNASINKALFTLHASSLIITTTLLFVGYTYLFNSIQSTSYTTEIVAFFLYKDMGFAQGYILLPIIIITALMTYKTEFIMQGEFTRISIQQLFIRYLRDNLAALCLLGLFLLLYFLNVSSQALYFYLGILLFAAYKVVLLKRP